MKTVSFIFFGVMLLTYAIPWVKVAEEEYAPGQLVIPYGKYVLRAFNILKKDENSPPSLQDVMTYEKSLQYLDTPPNEGGPNNQITFELMFYAMVATCVVLFIPLKIFHIIGYLLSLSTDAAFLLAMFFLEKKTIDKISYGLYGNLGASLVFLILTFIIE